MQVCTTQAVADHWHPHHDYRHFKIPPINVAFTVR